MPPDSPTPLSAPLSAPLADVELIAMLKRSLVGHTILSLPFDDKVLRAHAFRVGKKGEWIGLIEGSAITRTAGTLGLLKTDLIAALDALAAVTRGYGEGPALQRMADPPLNVESPSAPGILIESAFTSDFVDSA